MNTNFCFRKLFGHPQDIPAKSRDIPPKMLISLVSRDIPNFWRPPHHVEDSYPTGKNPDSKVWVCALFSCMIDTHHLGAEKAHKQYSHTIFLKTPSTAGRPQDIWPVSQQKCPFLPFCPRSIKENPWDTGRQTPVCPAARPRDTRPVSRGFS